MRLKGGQIAIVVSVLREMVCWFAQSIGRGGGYNLPFSVPADADAGYFDGADLFLEMLPRKFWLESGLWWHDLCLAPHEAHQRF